MKKIPLSKITDDMILAQPIIGASGNILMSPGNKLKTLMANRLEAWGVHEVWVESELQTDDVQDQVIVDNSSIFKAVEQRFMGRLVSQPMQILYSAILKHLGNYNV